MNKKNNLILEKGKSSEWDEGIFIILILVIIILPVIFYPYCMSVFLPIKELSLQILVVFALTLWMLRIITFNKLEWDTADLHKPIFLYLIIGSLSLTWSVNIYSSILNLPLFLAGPALYFIVSNTIKEQNKIEKLLLVIMILGTIMGTYGILQYFGIDFEFWSGNIGRKQIFGLFGNVNYFAEYLIFPLSLTIGLILAKNKIYNRLFLFIALIAMGGALFLTFTRGSYLAMAITVPVILFLCFKSAVDEQNKKRYKKIILYFILLAIIALAVIYIPHPFNRGDSALGKLRSRVTIESLTSGSSVLRRIATWKFTWMMIEDYPLLGSGIGTYAYHSLKYQADFFAQGNNRDIYPHGFAVQAHNEYLQIWSELGIVGLLIFLWIIFAYYRNIFINLHKMEEKQKAIVIGLSGGVTAVLVDSLFGFPLQLAASISLFWMFMGFANVQISISKYNAQENLIQKKEEIKKITNNQNNNTRAPSTISKKYILNVIVIIAMVVCLLFLIRPFIARVYWYYGNQQLINENYDETIAIYEKGLKWNPWQGELYYDIGNILAIKGINQLGLQYFHKAEKYIDNHNLPLYIATLYRRRGEIGKAIPYLEKAIKYQLNKKSMLPLQIQLGNIYLTVKDYKNAERHFAVVIENNPASAEGYYGIAGVYANAGKKEMTIQSLEKVIELAPESKLAGYAKTMLKKIEVGESKER
jgi:O-antigen ligase